MVIRNTIIAVRFVHKIVFETHRVKRKCSDRIIIKHTTNVIFNVNSSFINLITTFSLFVLNLRIGSRLIIISEKSID